MTEEEAKTKWCPMKRINPPFEGVVRNDHRLIHTCIGSACMMWRIYVPHPKDPNQSMDSGYCGLTGKR